MEGSESEAVFDSLNLNPQLFINEVLNCVDDLVDGAFDFFHQQASTRLKVEGTERSEDLSKGVDYLRNIVLSVLDKRLSMWEKYCLRHVFAVPEGFSLPKDNEAAGDIAMDVDTTSDEELDRQLISLRNKLALVEKETADLNKEAHELERRAVLSKHCSGPINEALQLYEDSSMLDMFQELRKLASELRQKVMQFKSEKSDHSTGHNGAGKMHNIPNGNVFTMNLGNGLAKAKMQQLQAVLAALPNV